MIVGVADTQLPQNQDDGLVFDTSATDAVSIRDEEQYRESGSPLQAARWADFADIYLLTGQHPLVAADVRAAISRSPTTDQAKLRPECDSRRIRGCRAVEVAGLAGEAQPRRQI